MFICKYNLLLLDDVQGKWPVRPGNFVKSVISTGVQCWDFLVWTATGFTVYVQWGGDLSDPLLLFMIFAKAVSLDIQSVEIGVRPVPQKRNVFCPCVLFQMQLFCGFFINFISLSQPYSLQFICQFVFRYNAAIHPLWRQIENKLDSTYLFDTECKWDLANWLHFLPQKSNFWKTVVLSG